MKPLHIVLDARHFRRSTGGIGRYTQNLIAELGSIDPINRYTLLLDPEDAREWQELVVAKGLVKDQFVGQVVDIPYYSLAEQTQMPKILRQLASDSTHFTNFNHPLRWSGRFLVTIHDLTILKYPAGVRQRSFLYQQAFRLTLRDAVARAQTILTVSQTVKDDLIATLGAKPEHVLVTYNGVDTRQFQPADAPERARLHRELTDRYGIRAPYALFTSQWRPHKGIATLVRAYEKLRRSQPTLKLQLVVAGKPQTQYPEILALIEQSPYAKDIIRPGFIAEDDLPKLYRAAELFVFPSLYEGFGITPIEAMASGIPVIASRASCMPEILGEAALFVDPENTEAWAGAMNNLLGDAGLQTKLRTAGLAQAKRYSWRTMADQTLAAYQAAAS